MTNLSSSSLNRREMEQLFVPGRWIERHAVSVSTFTAVGGTYERNESRRGALFSNEFHYFDMRLATRAPVSRGRLVDQYTNAEPLGEVIFVPAGHRYEAGGGPGLQCNFFLFLDADYVVDGETFSSASAISHPRDCMNLRSERIKLLLTQIYRELFSPGFASTLLLEGLGVTLQAETLRLLNHEQQRARGRGGLSPVHLRKIRELATNGNSLPKLDELAAACNLSRRHLTRAFRQETGQSVGVYIQQLAMERARGLLKESDEPIAAIAESVGFSSPAAFATAFRRATGDSPSAYRSIQRALAS